MRSPAAIEQIKGARALGRRLDKRIAAYQNELVSRHADEVQTIYREMRMWRHDYHNHIQTMKACLAMGQTDKLADYLETLDRDLEDVDTILRTGNFMVDAILNSKLSLAKARGIAVNASASVPPQLRVSDIDLCVALGNVQCALQEGELALGNLLDNAMEACLRVEREEERFLRVYIAPKKEQLYICVTNSSPGREKRLGGRFATRKSGFHGFGLLRIDRICEKYGGLVTRASEEGAFTSELLLPLA